ncbi:MAG: 2-polyprenylphenol 6-hydroxylase [Rickettsiaceae bacterium]
MLVVSLIQIIYTLTKHQIFLYNDNFKIPLYIKTIFVFLTAFLCPIKLFCKSKPENSLGARLKQCFIDLGPIYIKFGQTLSTRSDLVGNDIASQLQLLQDKLKPFDEKILKQILKQKFGNTIHDIFIEFDYISISAASIAQVHKAKLVSGELVAVKILRPKICTKYKKDLKVLKFLARISHIFLPSIEHLKLEPVIDLFNTTMMLEMDFRLEAAAASEMRDNFKDDTSVHIPKIFWKYSSNNILVMDWIDGVSLYDKEALIENNFDLSTIARKIAVIFFNQAFRDGFFHADLHPGNILIMRNGSIALLDFGIVSRLNDRDRIAIAEIFFGFFKKDYKLIARIHKEIGYIPKDTDLDVFAQYCRAVSEPLIELSAQDISIGNLLSQLFQITEVFGMKIQPQLILLQKTMIVVEGIGQILNPQVNMWQMIEDWIKKWANKNITPEAKLLRILRQNAIDFVNKIYQ